MSCLQTPSCQLQGRCLCTQGLGSILQNQHHQGSQAFGDVLHNEACSASASLCGRYSKGACAGRCVTIAVVLLYSEVKDMGVWGLQVENMQSAGAYAGHAWGECALGLLSCRCLKRSCLNPEPLFLKPSSAPV